MRTFRFSILIAGLCALGFSAMRVVRADDDPLKFAAKLDGFQEVGALNAETGAILSGGKGTLKISLDRTPKTFSFELTYSGLSAPVTQSHIHFGRVHTPGGIMVFFCTNLGNGPAGTPACPANGGTVTGIVSAGNVVGPTAQHVTAGDFDAVIEALLANAVYVNVHTQNFPAGEIRGQVLLERRRGDRDGRWRPGPFGAR